MTDYDKLRQPWRCDFCEKLIYSTDLDGKPIGGAPMPRYYDETYKNLCSVCHALVTNGRFDSNYWRELHRTWAEEEAKRRKNNDKLRGNTDYFTGA
jgi:hypothetical protein